MNITVHYNFLQLPNIITTFQKLNSVAHFTEKTFTPQNSSRISFIFAEKRQSCNVDDFVLMYCQILSINLQGLSGD